MLAVMSLCAPSRPATRSTCVRRAAGVLVIALVMAIGAVPARSAALQSCGDAPANYPRGGVYNVTAQVTRCYVARGIAVRWYFRDQHSPEGYRCRLHRTPGLSVVRCTHRGGRVVRFRYYLSPHATVRRPDDP
ncbi:MAG: hypothetical protein QOD69_3264 [Solirubrobacteraceae bacterium]|nr:hypothetical protein [Solirubrobacteraceae bacterium]